MRRPHSVVSAADVSFGGRAKIKVGVLGATGSVGQRFVQLLEGHPWFEMYALGASSRSAGKRYADAVNWKQATPIPDGVEDIVVDECDPSSGRMAECAIVFSGLDANFAGEIEDAVAAADRAVFSNAKNHRMDSDVPILIPPVNASHLDIVSQQRQNRGYKKGFIVTNANCSTTAMTIGLKPIFDAFGIETIQVSTMQAISGAGYPGLSSMDMLDNVVPYIGGEEEKMETESKKIFGTISGGKFVPAEMRVSAMCNRVHVLDGHTEAVSLKLASAATPEDVIAAIENFPSVTRELGMPSAPAHDVVYFRQSDRPQPRLDRMLGSGFTVSVGRVRPCNVLDMRLVVLGHNTIVGAAGGSILNAEYATIRGLIQ